MIGASVLYAAILLWGILCGAVVYEHLAIIPVWASNPPESLAMWTGPYPVKSMHFWPFIHPVIIVAILASIVLNWGNDARDLVALAGAGYVLAVIAPTAIWFVPELLRLIKTRKAASRETSGGAVPSAGRR